MTKILSSIVLVALLTGCGGSGSSEPAIGAFSASLTNQPALISESSSVTLTVAVSNIKNVANVTLTSSNPDITITKAGNTTFTLTAPDLNRDTSTTITMSATDGTDTTRSASQSFTMAIENTSFKTTLSEITAFYALRDRIINQTEEKAVLANLHSVATLVKGEQNIIFDSDVNYTQTTSLPLAINGIALNDYISKTGATTDLELTAQYSAARELVPSYLNKIKNDINLGLGYIAQATPSAIQISAFNIDLAKGTASFFVGNAQLGQYVDGQWTYNANTAYLDKLTKTTCSL